VHLIKIYRIKPIISKYEDKSGRTRIAVIMSDDRLLCLEVNKPGRPVPARRQAFCSFRRAMAAVNRRVSRSTYMSERRRR